MIYYCKAMSAELKLCKGCHKQKSLDQFDMKNDKMKLTCRSCLLVSKSRFQSKSTRALYRDIQKARMELMELIHLINDPDTLNTILSISTNTLKEKSEAEPMGESKMKSQ